MNYLEEYAGDSEISQNLMDSLSVLVKASNFKNSQERLQKNIELIFGYTNAIDLLFQLGSSDSFSTLILMDILRESLKRAKWLYSSELTSRNTLGVGSARVRRRCRSSSTV